MPQPHQVGRDNLGFFVWCSGQIAWCFERQLGALSPLSCGLLLATNQFLFVNSPQKRGARKKKLRSIFFEHFLVKITTTQAPSAGCGGNMSSRKTMLLAFSRGGPGSCCNRGRRGLISQKEKQSTADSQELESAFFKQPCMLENHTQAKTSPTHLLRRRYDE